MKKFFLPVLLVLALGATSSAFAQNDRTDRYDNRYDRQSQHDNRYDRRDHRRDDRRYDRRDDRRNDRRYHNRNDNRNTRVIVVPERRPYYQSPNYDYQRYNGYYNRSYVPSRYNSPQYYHGSRYVQHNGRYYDQCSNNDRQAAAAVGVVLGGLVGNQVSNNTGGTVAGAIIGGIIAHEVAKDQNRNRNYCWR